MYLANGRTPSVTRLAWNLGPRATSALRLCCSYATQAHKSFELHKYRLAGLWGSRKAATISGERQEYQEKYRDCRWFKKPDP